MAADEYTVSNGRGLVMTVSSFGARLVELQVPDRNGTPDNVVLGLDTLESYKRHTDLYLGATIGRVAGRISRGRFVSSNLDFQLDRNEGSNHLHGGSSRSFDRVDWSVTESESDGGKGIVFEYVSPHLEEGYPGNLYARVEYLLTDTNELWTVFTAACDQSTPVNLTNHSYWNLAGGNVPVTNHHLMIAAQNVLRTGPDLIPTGALQPVAGTALDYRLRRPIADLLPAEGGEPWPGLDHTYVLDARDGSHQLAATLYDPASGRTMELLTAEPSLQVYSANRLPRIAGRNGSIFAAGHALCLEPQHIPDSPALPEFPSIVLSAGRQYRHSSCYRFSAI